MFAAEPDVLGIFLELGHGGLSEILIGDEFGKPDDRVQGRAQFVAHGRQELGLGKVCLFGVFPGRSQGLLKQFPFRDVLKRPPQQGWDAILENRLADDPNLLGCSFSGPHRKFQIPRRALPAPGCHGGGQQGAVFRNKELDCFRKCRAVIRRRFQNAVCSLAPGQLPGSQVQLPSAGPAQPLHVLKQPALPGPELFAVAQPLVPVHQLAVLRGHDRQIGEQAEHKRNRQPDDDHHNDTAVFLDPISARIDQARLQCDLPRQFQVQRVQHLIVEQIFVRAVLYRGKFAHRRALQMGRHHPRRHPSLGDAAGHIAAEDTIEQIGVLHADHDPAAGTDDPPDNLRQRGDIAGLIPDGPQCGQDDRLVGHLPQSAQDILKPLAHQERHRGPGGPM